MKRWMVVGSLLITALTAGAVFAETCLSPYIKGLRQAEKVMYLWTLPVGQGADYLSVIDVDLASATYGRTLKKVEVGSSGNEALVSMASGADGTGSGGLAEFTNDGEFVASHRAPNHPYETVIKPEFNRMITSSWVSQKTFMSPLDKWDARDFSSSPLVWDLKGRKIIQELKGDPIPLAVRIPQGGQRG